MHARSHVQNCKDKDVEGVLLNRSIPFVKHLRHKLLALAALVFGLRALCMCRIQSAIGVGATPFAHVGPSRAAAAPPAGTATTTAANRSNCLTNVYKATLWPPHVGAGWRSRLLLLLCLLLHIEDLAKVLLLLSKHTQKQCAPARSSGSRKSSSLLQRRLLMQQQQCVERRLQQQQQQQPAKAAAAAAAANLLVAVSASAFATGPSAEGGCRPCARKLGQVHQDEEQPGRHHRRQHNHQQKKKEP